MELRKRLLFLLAVLWTLLATSPALGTYHPSQGRFLQRDPHGSGSPVHNVEGWKLGESPTAHGPVFAIASQYQDGLNLYEHVRSSPQMRRDPSGLFVSLVGMFAPMSTIDMYTDYNNMALDAGMSSKEALEIVFSHYGYGQLDAVDMIQDWNSGSERGISYAASGVIAAGTWRKVEMHHLVPRFLLGLNNLGNKLGLPKRDDKRLHRIIEQEFHRYGLNPPSSRGEKRWVTRLMSGDVSRRELARARTALMRAANIMDGLTDGQYRIARKVAASLDAGNCADLFKTLFKLGRRFN
jgi:hypothetical protein